MHPFFGLPRYPPRPPHARHGYVPASPGKPVGSGNHVHLRSSIHSHCGPRRVPWVHEASDGALIHRGMKRAAASALRLGPPRGFAREQTQALEGAICARQIPTHVRAKADAGDARPKRRIIFMGADTTGGMYYAATPVQLPQLNINTRQQRPLFFRCDVPYRNENPGTSVRVLGTAKSSTWFSGACAFAADGEALLTFFPPPPVLVLPRRRLPPACCLPPP
jgi:hypothetical protein